MSSITISSLQQLDELARENERLMRDMERLMNLTPQKIANFITYCRSLEGEPSITISLTEWGAPRSVKMLCRGARIRRAVIERIKESELFFEEEEEEAKMYRVTLVGENGEKAVIQNYFFTAEIDTPLGGSASGDYVELESRRLANIVLETVVKKGVDELGEVFYYPKRELKIKIV